MSWTFAETAHRQALLEHSLGLRVASRARSRSPAKADRTQLRLASVQSEAAQLEQAAKDHDRRAVSMMMQPGIISPHFEAEALMSVAGHFRIAARSFRIAAQHYETHIAKLANSNHRTLCQTPEAAVPVQSAPPVTSAPSSPQ